jgi:putative ABC transport system ATP-binding protein
MLTIQGLSKRFGSTAVFEGVSLTLAAGEFVALLGESGVGKSTLLNCIAGLDKADTGSVHLAGREITALSADQAALLRRHQLGFVFQAFHVLPHLSVAENVALPLWLQGQARRAGLDQAQAALEAVGLQGLGERWPAQLSGGQLQRVAIARALVHSPALLLADEPTGNLDPGTAARVLGALVDRVRSTQAACLLVTHSSAAAAHADRVLRLTAQGIEAVQA